MATTSRTPYSQIELSLRQNPLFGRLDNTQLTEMRKKSKVIDLAEGDVLFHHGDQVHNFYFVYKGLIKLYRQSTDGQEKIFELEGPGKIFAEALMFFDQGNYPVSASAMQKSIIVAINTQQFLNILKQSPETNLLIMGDLSRRLHEMLNEIEHLSLLSGRNRVATYFLDQALNKGTKFTLDIPKNAIASMLSLQPETFSRLIKELRTHKVIKVHDTMIQVLDIKLLRKYAGII